MGDTSSKRVRRLFYFQWQGACLLGCSSDNKQSIPAQCQVNCVQTPLAYTFTTHYRRRCEHSRTVCWRTFVQDAVVMHSSQSSRKRVCFGPCVAMLCFVSRALLHLVQAVQ